MRASTIFALTLALLIGLAAAVGVRWAGWLAKPVEPAKKEIQVLVAGKNLFPGDAIDSTWVKARALKPEEMAHYEANKAQYLPPVPQAAAFRVPNKSIEADAPLLRDDLKPMAKPDPLNMRLLPNMRAINVSVMKDHSAGGLIQVGEWIDVYLTTNITMDANEMTKTAPVALRVRVIAKRNALWNVFAALPDDKPVHFTLEANPYRAGLIEYSKTKGTLSLVPLSSSEQRVLEEKRTKLLNGALTKLLPVSFADPSQADQDQEESRVDALNRGEYSIGHADMVRIFDLKTGPPPTAENKVEHYSGLARLRTSRFATDGAFLGSVEDRRLLGGRAASQSDGGINNIRFSATDCPDCKKKKAQRKAMGQ